MINTLNETNLHKALKTLYLCRTENASAEVQIGSYIADIAGKDIIIEIQTGNLSKLLEKCRFYIKKNYKIKVVYPLITKKTIKTKNIDGKTTTRVSPKKGNIYSAFRELTGLVSILTEKNFQLDIVEVETIEERVKQKEAVQSVNKRRRFKKDWIKTGKSLETIGKIWSFNGKKSYTDLLPDELPLDFTIKDLNALIKIKNTRNELNVFLWVLAHSGIIECTGKKGKMNLYRK